MIVNPNIEPSTGGEILPWAKGVQKYIEQDNQRRIASPNVARRNTYRNRFPFQVEAASATTVTVRAGKWVVAIGSTRYTIPMGIDGGGTSSNRDDVLTLTLGGSAPQYVTLTLDDPYVPTTLTASLEPTPPTATSNTKKQIAHFSVSSGEFADVVMLDWLGGNLLSGDMAPDLLSLDRNGTGSDEKLQWYNFDNASDTAPVSADLFGYKDISTGKVAYCVANSIIEAADSTSFPVQNHGNLNGLLGDAPYYHLSLDDYNNLGLHEELTDVTDNDDHNGGRTPVAGSVNKAVYLHPEGGAVRNAMAAGSSIGDASGTDSISPDARTLDGAGWTVTDTTDATAGDGALVVDGGASIAKKLRVEDTTAADATTGAIHTLGGVKAENGLWVGQGARIEKDGNSYALQLLDSVGVAATFFGATAAAYYFLGGSETLALLDGTYGVNTTHPINTQDDYYQNGTQGVTGDGFSGGIKTDEAAADAHITALAEAAFLNLSTGGF